VVGEGEVCARGEGGDRGGDWEDDRDVEEGGGG